MENNSGQIRQSDLLALLNGRRGHFRMESGYHSELWFDLDKLFEDPARLQLFVDDLAGRLAAHNIEAICGPMTGGAKLADMLGAKLNIKSFHTERFETPAAIGLFPVRYIVPAALRGSLQGKRVAIVDDAISAGSAVKGTHTDLLACGARPVVCGALIIFGQSAAKFATEKSLRLESVVQMSYNMWLPSDCLLCRAGILAENISDVALNPKKQSLGA